MPDSNLPALSPVAQKALSQPLQPNNISPPEMLHGWSESRSGTASPPERKPVGSSVSPITFPELVLSAGLRDGMIIASGRQRTSQACDKCRERKTKCSGERPVCKRCTTRGLICTYSSREPRSRGPNKPRLRAASAVELPSVPPIHRIDLKPSNKTPLTDSIPSLQTQPRISRQQQQHYRTMSFPPRQQSVLPARNPIQTEPFADISLPPEPSNRHLPHDSHFRAKPIDRSFSLSQVAQPVLPAPGRMQRYPSSSGIQSISNYNTVNYIPFGIHPKSQSINVSSTSGPRSTCFEYMPLQSPFGQYQQLQGNASTPLNVHLWDPQNVQDFCDSFYSAVDKSTPPSLSNSTNSSATHSPSSSDHGRESHFQNMSSFDHLITPYMDSTICYPRSNVSHVQGPTDSFFESVEPASLLQSFMVPKEGSQQLILSSGASRNDQARCDIELQYPSPITPFGVEKIAAVIDSPAPA
ncbi:hypothetical protein AMATHDRAFT_44769 [Amanita thiersii Skay4041]|uniref:Zn(2)-C6 fungal-type domain-containing protein n=1 Tax=Amanita thiersii Skay4041 TaxID=703135 RepID=A0A2A9P001_9AGAR|nr:hypothetical protein AMATHDRAFT_44769 [Amanita thiersii Skay4041]